MEFALQGWEMQGSRECCLHRCGRFSGGGAGGRDFWCCVQKGFLSKMFVVFCRRGKAGFLVRFGLWHVC